MSIDEDLRGVLRTLADEAGPGPESRATTVRRRYRRRHKAQVIGTAFALAAIIGGVFAVVPLVKREHANPARLPADYYVGFAQDAIAPLRLFDAATGKPVRDVAPLVLTVNGAALGMSGTDPTITNGYVYLTRNGSNVGEPGVTTAALTRVGAEGGEERVLLTSVTDNLYEPRANESGTVVALKHGTRGADGSFTYRVELLDVGTGRTTDIPGLASDGTDARVLGWRGDNVLITDSAGLHTVRTSDRKAVSSTAVPLPCAIESTGASLGDGRLAIVGSTCDLSSGTNVLGVRVMRGDGTLDPVTVLGPGSDVSLYVTSRGALRVWVSGFDGCPVWSLWAVDGTSANQLRSNPVCPSPSKN